MIDPSRSPVFVGRAAEMALLDGALAQAMGGRPAVVVVGGEAGIGKSRLVSEFAARAAGDALVLVGRCHPGPTVLPYAPLAEVLRELAARLPSDDLAAVLGPAASELGVVVPELERPGRAPAPDLPVESRAIARTRLLGLLAGIVDRLAELTPVAVAIEDVQWADAASIDALEFLVRAANRQRTLLVVTVRTDEGAVRARLPAIAELERAGSVERVELRRLTRTEVAAQIAGALGTAPGDDLAARIAARSDGNPFFVEELLAAERRGDPIGLTPRLDDLMRARVAAVPPQVIVLLRTAAVGGLQVDDGLLARLTDLPAVEAAAGLRLAADAGLLVRSASPTPQWEFRHTLLQEFIVAELLPGEARDLHGRWAETLGQLADPDLAAGAIARHWLSAARADRALPAVIAAGLAAERRLAFGDARHFFEIALELWERTDMPEDVAPALDRPSLLAHAADAAGLSGDVAAAVAYARRGLSEIEPAADPHGAAYLHERLRWYLWEGGDQAGAERALDEAYALVPADPPNTARARVLAQLAGVRMRQGRLTESSALAEESNQMARSVGALPELAFALGVRAWDRTMLGLAVEGLADLRDAAAIADLLESAEGRALGVANRALMLLYLGRDGEALEVARAGRSTVRAVGLAALFDARLAATAAAACFRLGSWSDAAILCREALDEGPARADSVWVGAVAARLGAAMGDDDLVRAGFELSARDQSANLEPLYTSWLELARLEVARTAGSTDGSVSPETTRAPSRLPVDVIADEATASIAAATIRTAADRAEVARAAGFSSDADAESRLAVDLLTTWRARRAAAAGRTADEGGITAAEAMAEAELGRASGASDPALWERAVAAEEARALPYPAAYARFRHAESIVQRPTAVSRRDAVRAAAADEAQTARASAVALGARPLIEAIDSLIRRARLDDVPAGRRPTEAETATTPGLDQVAAFVERRGLTPREVEVLKLLAAGWSNGEIGRALFITRKTASVHISNILGKLGAANRVEAAAMAQRVGVVGPSRPGSALEELRERANSRA